MRNIRKMISRYKGLSAGIKASVAFVFCSILQKGINIITVPIFTRSLTTSEYGEYSVFQSWLSIITILATLNLGGGGFNNGMLKYPEDRNGYISSMQGLSTLVTGFIFLVYLVFQNYWNQMTNLSSIVMYTMFFYLIFHPSIGFWSSKNRYEYKYVALVIYTLLFSIAEPVAGIIAISMAEEKGIARILSFCFVHSVSGLVFYILNLIRGKKIFDQKYWRFALVFNFPLIPHYLSNMVLSSSDRIMIEKMVSTSAVAFYSVSYNIGMIMNIFVTSINSSFVPWTFESMKKGDYSSISKLSNGLIMLIGIIAMIPIMFGPEAVQILGSSKYMEAIWVIPPVAISTVLVFIYTLFANIEFYFEKTQYVMIATMIAAVSNVVLNYICINLFGYLAAGYTTLICFGIMVFMHYFFMKKILTENNIEDIYDIKYIFLLLSIILALSFVFMLLYKRMAARYITILIICIIVVRYRNYFINIIKRIKL